jgi:excisionase family DNA binding protein
MNRRLPCDECAEGVPLVNGWHVLPPDPEGIEGQIRVPCPNALPPMLGIGEVAAMLGLHRNTLGRLRSSELPYYRVCSRGDRRYRLADVERFLEERRVG